MEKKTNFQLSKKQKRSYALGAIPGGLLAYVFGLYYIDFFYQDVGMDFGYMVIGLIIYAVINAINDPLLGQLSDKTDREKWGGRRIPYIKYGAPIWAISFVLLWFPWSLDNQIIMLLHYTITICAYDMMLTLVILCWMALLPEMTSNIDERNQTNFLVLLIGFFGLLPFLILVPIFKAVGLPAFQLINIIIAIVSVVCYMVVVRNIEEKPEFKKDEVFTLKTSIKEVVKYKSFRAYVGYNFCISFNGAIGMSFLFAYGH
ncbi:MAG: MFS transporter, partial [archaeon]|nr:MFS transporter [archaeon]